MLRQVDAGREIFRVPVEPTDMGARAQSEFSSLRTETGSANFQPTVIVVSTAQQGREKTVLDRANVPRRIEPLRLEVRTVLTVSRRHLRGIRCLLKGSTVGNLCLISRRHSVAKQAGWERALAVDLSSDVSRAAALVSRWEEDHLFCVRTECRETRENL